MGLYMYINEQDISKMRKVEDQEVQELFNEALGHDKSLFISETTIIKKHGLLKRNKHEIRYSIYHQCMVKKKPIFEVRQQISASGAKPLVMAYLYGIINGSLARSRR